MASERPKKSMFSEDVTIPEYDDVDLSMLNDWLQLHPVRKDKRYEERSYEGSTWCYQPIPEIRAGRHYGPARLCGPLIKPNAVPTLGLASLALVD